MGIPDKARLSARGPEPPPRQRSEETSERNPRVTIGLPVFNGERYIEETLDSIQAQTFRDWELVICDNASTDRTSDICSERAARDPRIRVFRNPSNIGGDRNYNRCFALSRGEYFFGIGADDIAEPEYLARTVAAMDAHPEAVFCHTRSRRMDPDGRPMDPYPPREFSASRRPSVRLREAILDTDQIFVCLGLLRASALRQTPMLKPHPYSDSFLQAQLALIGPFVEIPEFLFRRRHHGPTMSIYDRAPWVSPEDQSAMFFPHWRRNREYFAAAAGASGGIAEKSRCLAVVFRYALRARQASQLLRDLRMAGRRLILRTRLGRRLRDARRRAA